MASFQDDFLARIEQFLLSSKITPTKFGIDAAGDPRFVFDLREGRSCGMKLADKVVAFIDSREATTAPAARQSRIRITPLGDEAA